MKRIYILLALLVLMGMAAIFRSSLRQMASYAGIEPGKTVEQRLQQYGEAARTRLRPYFEQAQVTYPPKRLALVGLKAERELQIYAIDENGTAKFVRTYPVLAASGVAGPKLREGDRQVPEGIYGIELLNPNSSYHLSLRVSYPNAFDREQARKEQRTNLGGDIMIHGRAVSIGCLAMGDEAAEDLFVLAADTGIKKITVILSPVDFRTGKTVPDTVKLPEWTPQLYQEIRSRLAELPLPKDK
ncbi:MAG TPA: L,D-transpeptidase family protein [Verrucomicrobiae bacterium]|nr:L,D-transpeptidase family protein [Verrucomicrobiae bacterium]